jgi:hypothetical protein
MRGRTGVTSLGGPADDFQKCRVLVRNRYGNRSSGVQRAEVVDAVFFGRVVGVCRVGEL